MPNAKEGLSGHASREKEKKKAINQRCELETRGEVLTSIRRGKVHLRKQGKNLEEEEEEEEKAAGEPGRVKTDCLKRKDLGIAYQD